MLSRFVNVQRASLQSAPSSKEKEKNNEVQEGRKKSETVRDASCLLILRKFHKNILMKFSRWYGGLWPLVYSFSHIAVLQGDRKTFEKKNLIRKENVVMLKTRRRSSQG